MIAQVLIGLLPLIQQRILDHSIISDDVPLGPMLVAAGADRRVRVHRRTTLRRYLGAKVSVYLQHDLRLAIHRHLYELDFSRHDELSVGDVMSRSTADLTLIQAFFFSVPMLVANMTLLVVAIVVMFVLSPVLSLVVVVFVPVFAFVAVRFRDRVFPASWNDQRLSGAVAGVVDEAVTGVRVVKAFAQEQREFDRLTEQAHELYQSRMRTARYNARYSSTLQALPMLGQLGVLALGGWLALRGHITLGVFLAFASYLVQIITPVRLVVEHARHDAAGAGRRRAGLRAARPAAARHRRARSSTGRRSPRRHRARPRRLRLPGRTADACATSRCAIRPGERIGLVGASGSGKSTLAYLIARFYDPTSGTVRLDGTDVRELTLESLRSTVNVVFEESFLFSTTHPREHRLRPTRRQRRRHRGGSARGRRPTSSSSSCRDGYDTVVGERGFTLSGGQRQRIALARAALANPKVLVLDDATSAIDAHTEEAHPRLPGRRAAGADHRADRPPLVDAAPRRPGHRARRRPHRRRGHQRRAVAHVGALPRAADAGPSCRRSTSTPIVDEVDPDAWPSRERRRRRCDRITSSWRRSSPSMATGGGGNALGVIGARAGLVAATPELLAQVDALPPLRGDPDVDLVAATAEDGSSSLRRLAHRFRWAFVAVAGLVLVDAGTTLVGPLHHPPRPRRRGQRRQRRGAAGDVRRLPGGPAAQLGQPDRRAPVHVADIANACCTHCEREPSPTCNASRSTTTTGRWAGGS